MCILLKSMSVDYAKISQHVVIWWANKHMTWHSNCNFHKKMSMFGSSRRGHASMLQYFSGSIIQWINNLDGFARNPHCWSLIWLSSSRSIHCFIIQYRIGFLWISKVNASRRVNSWSNIFLMISCYHFQWLDTLWSDSSQWIDSSLFVEGCEWIYSFSFVLRSAFKTIVASFQRSCQLT